MTSPGTVGHPDQRWAVPTGWALIHRPVTNSTNDDGRALARDGCPNRTVIVADVQRQGRGRLGRSWLSTPGGSVLASVVLREGLPPIALTAIVSLAIAQAIETATGFPTHIKWPNDVVLRDKKVCGVLTEVVPGTEPVAVVGFGINVNLDPVAAGLPDTATSLAQVCGRWIARALLLFDVLQGIDSLLTLPADTRVPTILARWEQRLWRHHQRVTIDDAGAVFEGTVLGLASSGALRVQLFDGAITTVHVGDLSADPA